MATYFQGTSEIQGDCLQTLYLMNPGYVGYSDTQLPGNLVYMNSSANRLNPMNLSQSPQENQHLVGIPLHAAQSQDHNRSSVHAQHEISMVHSFAPPRVHYNLWQPVDPNTAHHHMGAPMNNSQFGVQRSAQQGLSLTLSSHHSAYGQYRADITDTPTQSQAHVISPTSGDEIRVSNGNSSSSASGVSNGNSSMQSVLLGSKYLKAAQQVLDEVVNVGNGIKTELSKGSKEQRGTGKESTVTAGEASIGEEMSVKRGVELTTAERQELQMKKAKLVSMLDEVEQRYRQYNHQMQIVVSSFEQTAGFGSARTYTALALQTISKQSRCLKDAISGQIVSTSKSLGEEDCIGGKIEGSRLRFVDHQLRQQRALQQLGMIQHNTWRPQRGLPERSVSILRAWLFEHFLHPYPKDSDKVMLAKQTGLTRSQVSNWFINARVRLWKPMVEEMYMEETKDREQNGMEEKTSKSKHNENSGAPLDTSPNRTDQIKCLNPTQVSVTDLEDVSPHSISNSSVPTSTLEGNIQPQAGFFLRGISKPDGILRNAKKSRNNELQNSHNNIQSIDMDMEMKLENTNGGLCMNFGNDRQSRDGYSLMTRAANHGGGEFGAYPMGGIGRFDHEQFTPRFSGNNGVSLTLGLPHCENIPLSGAQQTYLSNQNIHIGRRLEMSDGEPNDFCGINTPPPNYENVNMENRKRFASQLLPDFVT
ncbi:hypothetical protein GIB67_042050 [Kingdonia uniflora]|uniref:Homeobox domain-containing protein n=1 Tax=Kingdonia uniflora TaxID=39325 RepID=A0A7J7MVK1_9MAGN|nr:hypothetical protein GIB67_042050 [Kingdonia uniflora]